jgi:protein-tyrosine phosphatase
MTEIKDHYSVAIGAHCDNANRNRYLQVEPYDRTRVIVGERGARETPIVNGDSDSDKSACEGSYLNASWVLERFGGKWWIATQAALPYTAHTLLSLVLQPVTTPPTSLLPKGTAVPTSCRVRTIVQLTRNVEEGRRKADAYFPTQVGQSLILPPDSDLEHEIRALKVTLLERKTIEESHCIQSTLSLVPLTSLPSGYYSDEGSNDSRSDLDEDKYGEEDGAPIVFNHLLYVSWPDFGVPQPDDRKGLLSFVHLVDKVNRDTSNLSKSTDPNPHPDPPIIVGCSAGIGRTGSFITITSLLRHFGVLPPASSPTPASCLPDCPLGPLPKEYQQDMVAQEVDSLREQRPGMVQREEQISLIYEILATALSQQQE